MPKKSYDQSVKTECERMYIEELLSPKEICTQAGVALKTIYDWKSKGKWDELRDSNMGLREKLSKLICKLIDNELENQEKIDSQKIHGLVNILEKYQKTGAVREKTVYVEDAEVLLETLKEMDQFKELLEDPEVLSELGERLKEKTR